MIEAPNREMALLQRCVRLLREESMLEAPGEPVVLDAPAGEVVVGSSRMPLVLLRRTPLPALVPRIVVHLGGDVETVGRRIARMIEEIRRRRLRLLVSSVGTSPFRDADESHPDPDVDEVVRIVSSARVILCGVGRCACEVVSTALALPLLPCGRDGSGAEAVASESLTVAALAASGIDSVVIERRWQDAIAIWEGLQR